MRTTLNVDDDVLEAAKSIAQFRHISVGEALSELARKGLNTPVGTRVDPDTGFLVFDTPNVPRFGSEDVQRILDEDGLESFHRIFGTK